MDIALPTDDTGGPARCCVFLSDNRTGGPVSGALAFLEAQLTVLEEGSDGEVGAAARAGGTARIPLGLLGSDHAGYLSWDLAPLWRQALQLAERPDGSTAEVRLAHVWLYLGGPLQSAVDVLAEADERAQALVLRLGVDRDGVFTGSATGFPAMQSPSLLDWYLSPGSFAYVPAELIGQDGCETLLPSNVATQQYQVHQIVTVPDLMADLDFGAQYTAPTGEGGGTSDPSDTSVPSEHSGPSDVSPSARALAGFPVPIALVISYDVTWIPVGHGLGQVTYSLPLAPGEQVQLAVVDWSRTSTDSRLEDIALTDDLEHALTRDRTVDEVVKGAVNEWQRGGSVMTGAAGAASMGMFGGSAAIGGGYATTSGDRSVSADTVQNLHDQIRQHSTSVRDMRSTVVVQSRQAESSTAQTRTVRNHNHAHAMTLLYYEVLRHFRVLVERGRVRPAVLLPAASPNLDDELVIVRYRRLLQAGLLDPQLAGGFDAVEKYAAWRELQPEVPVPPDPGSVEFILFQFRFTIGDLSSFQDRVPTTVTLTQRAPDGGQKVTQLIRPQHSDWDPDPTHLQNPGDFQHTHAVVDLAGVPRPDERVNWRDLRTISVTLVPPHTEGRNDDVAVEHLVVTAVDTAGNTHLLVDEPSGKLFQKPSTTWALAARQAPEPAPAPTPFQRLSDEENLLRIRLRRHLVQNREHYYRLIRLGEDPNARWTELAGSSLTVGDITRPLFQAVENRALEVLGDATAFPLDPALFDGAGEGPVRLPEVEPARSEQLVSLPTRGVFAEAKLGHCNSAEVIDNTRFWDWQKSPDPDSAPQIAPVSTASREVVVSTTPSGLPASAVTIVQPPQAPDPVGMAAALQLLGKGDIFRDESMQKEVAALLTSLASNAAGLAGKNPGTPGVPGTPGSGPTPGTGTGGGAGPGTPGTGSGPGAPTGGGTGIPGGGMPGGGPGTGGTMPPGTGGTPADPGGTPGTTGPGTQPGTGDGGSGTPKPPAPAPRPTPRPPVPIGSDNRSFVFSFAPVSFGPSEADWERGRFAIAIFQDGKPVLSQDNVEPAAPSVILNGKVAPDKPLDVVVDGSSTHWVTYPSIYSSAMAGNPSTRGTPPGVLITTHLVGKLTLAGLDPKQRSDVFSIQREVKFTSVTLSEQQIRQQGLEKVVSGQINASFDKVISFGAGLSSSETSSTSTGTTTNKTDTVPVTFFTGLMSINQVKN
ncbi:hypothetical protein [Streptomyces sp. NPDC001657]|uniref:hypothetical protein n=1 Tax=Streptomyces sp. NPDC001657 TaxID=3154522 RepID=UPI003322949B